ncbi:hypothetical protein I551_7225 [Mycobacterium ulcerans str. Harvey]|uniref:Uncharacterized protein n=1 Tax=Mycobacterium ulcerans str. Harvey TaxID=1299332 RepID=A0ABN0QNX2_MYCUL|nr:hypothetical protein I551_7225 [Mycobacterium ulcerans str. Harvey]
MYARAAVRKFLARSIPALLSEDPRAERVLSYIFNVVLNCEQYEP